MELFFSITLFATGIINFLPALLAILPSRIKNSYGIEVPDASVALLMRHRAVLFGIIGGFMMYAAFQPAYFSLATLMGLLSMASFVLLYFAVGKNVHQELKVVVKMDIFAAVILVTAYILYRFNNLPV